ncbi:MAG TPA: hypothetical protein VKA19_11315 [Alphaproteobacteria bacterium]|nr:hypothetical protein [Alphaproteobacteria bacterium]
MFIGHYAVGFAAKKAAPNVSLGALFAACQLADLLWPTLVLFGVESFKIEPGATAVNPLVFTHYPYSHSLAALVLWGVLFGGGYVLLTRSRLAAGLTIAAVVVSHWLLDVIVHVPDMPLWPGTSPLFGLGLWNSVPETVVLEVGLFLVGVAVYVRVTKARDRAGSIGFWSLVGFLLLVYAANLFGPPPSNVRMVAWSAEALWLVVLWGYWIDRHRLVRVL